MIEHPLDGKMEPEAKDIASSPTEAAAISIAVSLKRIADFLQMAKSEHDSMTARDQGLKERGG